MAMESSPTHLKIIPYRQILGADFYSLAFDYNHYNYIAAELPSVICSIQLQD